jgi:Flp pilus assembly pilin Flp
VIRSHHGLGPVRSGVEIHSDNEMQLRAHRTVRRSGRRRGTRGATVTEYALILFVVAVVGALGFRFFGQKLEGGVGKAGSNLDSPTPTTATDSNGAGGGAGNGNITTTHGAGAGGGGDPTQAYGPRTRATAQEGTPFAKFAMIALGIIGAGAAFFALMKGKHAR